MVHLMFCAYHFFQQANQFSTISGGGRLFQQYVGDHISQVDSRSIAYLRHNHVLSRTADYASLCEQLGAPGSTEIGVNAVQAGFLFIFPSFYVGGDRYMRQNMHDFIAISNKVGYPDIFLTMICNPRWHEINNASLPG